MPEVHEASKSLQFHWYQLKPDTLLLVNREFLVGLFQQCIARAGTLNRFCRTTGLTFPSIHNYLHGRLNLVSIRKLIMVLDYLGISYALADKQILEIRKGKTASVVYPHFPIDLDCPDMGVLLGHVVSDGSIYVDMQRNHLRTKYTNSDAELIVGFLASVQRLFGRVHYTSEPVRGAVTIRFGSELVGKALAASGAMIGNKTKQNGNLPWLVRRGSGSVKTAYLRAAFSDEASVGASRGFPFILLTRYCTIPAGIDAALLGRFDSLMRSSTFPTGHRRMSVSLKRATHLMTALGAFSAELLVLFRTPPRLLSQEVDLLADLGVKSRIYPGTLCKNHSGSYSLSFVLAIQGRKNVSDFYKKVGFSLPRKQEKLRIFLEEKGWI